MMKRTESFLLSEQRFETWRTRIKSPFPFRHYIDTSKKISPEKYNEWYLQSNRDLDRLAAIIKINFNELSGQFDELASLTNIFWGNQHNLLHNKENNDKEGCQFFRDKIAADSNKIKRISQTLIDGMTTVANRLNQSLASRTVVA